MACAAHTALPCTHGLGRTQLDPAALQTPSGITLLTSPPAAAAGIGLLWVGLGGALLLATEFLTDAISLSVYYALAAACITVGAFTTHGLAGFLRFSGGGSGGTAGSGNGGSSGWRFWQPFRGGTAFVLAQVRAGGPPGCLGWHGAWAAVHLSSTLSAAPLASAAMPARHPWPHHAAALDPCAGAGLGALLLCAGGLPLPAPPGGGGGGLLVRQQAGWQGTSRLMRPHAAGHCALRLRCPHPWSHI